MFCPSPTLVKTKTLKSYWFDCLYVNVIFFVYFHLDDTTPTDSGDLLNVYLQYDYEVEKFSLQCLETYWMEWPKNQSF